MDEPIETITFVTPEREQIGFEHLTSVPVKGNGVYDGKIFWRVTDVWFNGDNAAGPLPYGWIVKIQLPVGDDHAPRDFDEDYYSN